MKLAHALEGLKLPPEVALMPGTPYYRAEDHQLVPSVFVGHAQAKGTDDPEDLFVVDQVVNRAGFHAARQRNRVQARLSDLTRNRTPRPPPCADRFPTGGTTTMMMRSNRALVARAPRRCVSDEFVALDATPGEARAAR